MQCISPQTIASMRSLRSLGCFACGSTPIMLMMANSNHKSEIEHYKELQLEQNELRENWEHSRENTGTAPAPYLARYSGYPLGYGTTDYISKQAVAKFYSSISKVFFAFMIFFTHWHIAKMESDVEQP